MTCAPAENFQPECQYPDQESAFQNYSTNSQPPEGENIWALYEVRRARRYQYDSNREFQFHWTGVTSWNQFDPSRVLQLHNFEPKPIIEVH